MLNTHLRLCNFLSSESYPTKMLRQVSVKKKLLSHLRKNYRLNQINEFSNDSIKHKENDSKVLNTDELPDTSSCNTEDVSHLLEGAATFNDAKNKDWATSPYPSGTVVNQPEESKPQTDPKSTSVLLFPGQGTIKVGMIKKYMQYPAAKDLFDVANEIIDYNLLKLCLNGPQEKLNRTEFNQAATVLSSLVALEKLRDENPKVFETCVATAGYSVGEITALILSGAITFEDGIRLAWVRGKAMQQASDMSRQGMMSIHCKPYAEVAKACSEAEAYARNLGIENSVCRVAIFLHTERKILAGNMEALEFIDKHAPQFGLSNCTKLPVSGAFHTSLMEPAVKSVSKVVGSIRIDEPRCKVYSNYKGQPYSNLRFMKKNIVKQMVSPVKWEQCLQHIYQRPEGTPFPQTYDVGSQGRLKIILHLINAKACRSCTVI